MSADDVALAKVAYVKSLNSVVINKGSLDGIKVGDNFLIFGVGLEIVDPDTKQSLGNLELVRGRAKVTHVQESMAILVSAEQVFKSGSRKTIRRDHSAGSISRMLGGGGSIEEIEEPAQKIAVDLDNPKIGDFARPV